MLENAENYSKPFQRQTIPFTAINSIPPRFPILLLKTKLKLCMQTEPQAKQEHPFLYFSIQLSANCIEQATFEK